MSNATARVPMTKTQFGDDKKIIPLASTAASYYPGAAIGRNSSGYGCKCDDSALIRFEGINAESQKLTVDSGGSNGDSSITVDCPRLFTGAIASAALGDEGKPVFWTDDQTLTYTPTTYCNFAGWVNRIIDSTHVEVHAHYGYPPTYQIPLDYLAAAVDGQKMVKAVTGFTIVSAVLRPLVAGTDGSAVTVAVKKVASGTAIGSGTAVHSGTGDLKGTINTDQALTLTSAAVVAAGSEVGLDVTGTLTSAIGTVMLTVIPFK